MRITEEDAGLCLSMASLPANRCSLTTGRLGAAHATLTTYTIGKTPVMIRRNMVCMLGFVAIGTNIARHLIEREVTEHGDRASRYPGEVDSRIRCSALRNGTSCHWLTRLAALLQPELILYPVPYRVGILPALEMHHGRAGSGP